MGIGEPGNPQNIADKDDMRKVYQQNNYSNQILHTIAEQLDHVYNKIDNKIVKGKEKIDNKKPISFIKETKEKL